MSNYDYPPSRYILKYGPIVENSHFYVEGVGHFDTGDENCKFEVAYTYDCRVIVVCYLSHSSVRNVLFKANPSPNEEGPRFIERGDSIRCAGFIGKQIDSDATITVEESILFSYTHPTIEPIIFLASRFKCSRLNSERSVSGSRWRFYVTGVSQSFSGQWFAGIHSEYPQDATLQVARKFDERQYDNQPTAELTIPESCIPTGWNIEHVADLWCALMSLADRGDIQWVDYCLLDSRENCLEEIWQRRTILGKWRHGGRLPIAGGTIVDFIAKLFAVAFSGKVSEETAMSCVEAIRHYVFSLLTTTIAENQARLMTSYIEAFLLIWEKENGQHEHIMTKSEADSLTALLSTVARDRASEYLLDYDGNDRKSIERLTIVLEKIEKGFRDTIRKVTLRERLIRFININRGKHIENASDLPLPFPVEILKIFKDTRDEILHNGDFLGPDAVDIWSEYANMLVILPLMVLSIFGYDGPYIDLSNL